MHGAENAILMRDGACAAELRLMVVEVGFRLAMVCVFVVLSFCGVSSLLREGVFGCVFLGLRLYLFFFGRGGLVVYSVQPTVYFHSVGGV